MARIAALTIPQQILTATAMSIRQLDQPGPLFQATCLPPEILVNIFSWCCILSRINLGLTCRRFAKVAVVNRVLNFDTSIGSRDRQLIVKDDFVRFSFCKWQLDRTWAQGHAMRRITAVSEICFHCKKCSLRRHSPRMCPGLINRAKKHIRRNQGFRTRGVMVLLARKIQLKIQEWSIHLENRAYVTLRYGAKDKLRETLERVKNVAMDPTESDGADSQSTDEP